MLIQCYYHYTILSRMFSPLYGWMPCKCHQCYVGSNHLLSLCVITCMWGKSCNWKSRKDQFPGFAEQSAKGILSGYSSIAVQSASMPFSAQYTRYCYNLLLKAVQIIMKSVTGKMWLSVIYRLHVS